MVVDKESLQIVDGFHRYYAFRRAAGKKWETAEAHVVLRAYASTTEMFVDAMRLNASHGRNLSAFDKAHCVLLAERLKIEVAQVAASLSITIDKVGELRTDRVGLLKGSRNPVALKNTISHMAGHTLTDAQMTAQEKLGGMHQLFYCNQLIVLIENDLLDKDNENLMQGLKRLQDLLVTVLRKGAVAA